jgi:Transglycosylase SLT domain
MRRGIWAGIVLIGFAAVSTGRAAEPSKPQMTAEIVKQLIENRAGSSQRITFPDTEWSPVRVVRGSSPPRDKIAQRPEADKAEVAEIVTFGDSPERPVRIVRGDADRVTVMSGPGRPAHAMTVQLVTFTDTRERPVSILRGSVPRVTDTELFGPASLDDLDRVAFAVDGAESSHGADLRMWRPEPSGPQGPMQITAAAATDVGGGDRYDVAENRALGRAYLTLMYRRYGNWPDAVAAYNWGPGNLDSWISGGRATDKFPLEVEHYRDRVLGEAALAGPNVKASIGGWPFPAPLPPVPANQKPLPAAAAALIPLPGVDPRVEYAAGREPAH